MRSPQEANCAPAQFDIAVAVSLLLDLVARWDRLDAPHRTAYARKAQEWIGRAQQQIVDEEPQKNAPLREQ